PRPHRPTVAWSYRLSSMFVAPGAVVVCLAGLPGHTPVPGPDNHTTARALGQRPRRLAEVLAHQAAGLPAAAQPEGRYDLVGAGWMAGQHRAATLARGVAQRLA